MATDPDDVVMRDLADALNHPEGEERHQRAKAELNYRQLNAQTKATKPDWKRSRSKGRQRRPKRRPQRQAS